MAATPIAHSGSNSVGDGGAQQPFLCPETRAASSPLALRSETLRRIEVSVLHLLHNITCGGSLSMEDLSTTSSSTSDGSDTTTTVAITGNTNTTRIRVSGTTTTTTTAADAVPASTEAALATVTSFRPHPRPPHQLRRARNELLVLRLLHCNVRQGIAATQRDLYYRLVREVPDQTLVNSAVLRLAERLRVPRESLGVVAGVRGSVAGALSYRGVSLMGAGSGGEGGGMSIPVTGEELRVRPMHPRGKRCHGGCGGVRDGCPMDSYDKEMEEEEVNGGDGFFPFVCHPSARFILVVEKHAVFHRLLQERLPSRLPCVLLTSCGFPTHAARSLLHELHAAAPLLPVVGLVDFNPNGIAILLQYKWGSRGGGGGIPSTTATAATSTCVGINGKGMIENRFTSVPAVRWLGLRGSHIGLAPQCSSAREGRHDSGGGDGGDSTSNTNGCRPSKRRRCPGPPAPPPGLPHQAFTARDTAVMRNLLRDLQIHRDTPMQQQQEQQQPSCRSSAGGEDCAALSAGPLQLDAWVAEAGLMSAAGVKVEIEAMYTRGTVCDDESGGRGGQPAVGTTTTTTADAAVASSPPMGFAEWVCQRLLRRDYI